MAKTLQFRRYTTSNLASIVGSVGELIVDTTLDAITVHDGSKSGGWYTANAIVLQAAFNQANAAYAQANTDLAYLASNVAIILGIDVTQNSIANLAFTQANSSYDSQNTTGSYANSAFLAANIAGNDVATSANYANGAFIQANAAFLQANTAATTVPQNPQTTNYVLQLSDSGKHIYYTQASNTTLYIPNSEQESFQNGATVLIVSQTTSSANVTITPNTGVSLYLAGNTTSNSRNVTTYGMATLIMVAANTWFINGTGVT